MAMGLAWIEIAFASIPRKIESAHSLSVVSQVGQ